MKRALTTTGIMFKPKRVLKPDFEIKRKKEKKKRKEGKEKEMIRG